MNKEMRIANHNREIHLFMWLVIETFGRDQNIWEAIRANKDNIKK